MASTENQKHDDDTPGGKRFKACDNGGAGSWSDRKYHALSLVMMKLEIVDYLSFGGVCKSWRLLALSERNIFMASKPLMTISVDWHTRDKTCSLKDFEGRKIQTTTLGSFSGGTYIGLTCGYLIFFRRKTKDFWLVNPITRHQLYLNDFPHRYKNRASNIRAIFVFSHSVCGWVFFVMNKDSSKIWFSIAGTGAWNHVSFRNFSFTDLHVFKGKIYTLNYNYRKSLWQLHELRLNPQPNLTLIETNNSLISSKSLELVSSGDKIYVMDRTPTNEYTFQELDFGEMKWVVRETTMTQYPSFLSNLKYGVADKQMFGDSRGKSLLLGHDTGDMLKLIEVEKSNDADAKMWYFLHECLNVDHVDL